jgi:hypothetical protein
LGAPGWRALGGVMQVEKPALLRLLAQDATSVLIDARAVAGLKLRLRNAVSIPLPEASKAKDDGRLPMTDHNTRIFVAGSDGTEARAVAEESCTTPFTTLAFLTVRSPICLSCWKTRRDRGENRGRSHRLFHDPVSNDHWEPYRKLSL